MKNFVKGLVWLVAFLGALAGIVYATIFDFYVIPSDDIAQSLSFAPSLSAGDVLLLKRHGGPVRRDIVRCPDPQAKGRFVVGRVLGITGDHVTVEQGHAWVNEDVVLTARGCDRGRKAFDPTSGDTRDFTCEVERIKGSDRDTEVLVDKLRTEPRWEATVEPGKVAIVSDNRSAHVDSRDYGQLDASSCSVIAFRIWTTDPDQSRIWAVR
jgi:signal peptidase I